MQSEKTLIFIPTYNESGNIVPMCEALMALNLNVDILFIDDNSPDGTGRLLDILASKYKNVKVIHSHKKQGVGGAHLAGIHYAYRNKYNFLITLDGDFTHQPSDIPRLYALREQFDIVIGSRFIKKNSMPNWPLSRRCLTYTARFLTKLLLGIKQDASTALRLYNLQNIPHAVFKKINSSSYSFFFESLFYLKQSQCTFSEIPVELHPRFKGKSKMNPGEALRSGIFLISLVTKNILFPGKI